MLRSLGDEQIGCCGDGNGEWLPLNRAQRWARLIAGLVLLNVAVVLPWSAVGSIVLALVLGWVGASHVVAAATAYPGCPELGAVPRRASGAAVRPAFGDASRRSHERRDHDDTVVGLSGRRAEENRTINRNQQCRSLTESPRPRAA
jgi:hypothetical protein